MNPGKAKRTMRIWLCVVLPCALALVASCSNGADQEAASAVPAAELSQEKATDESANLQAMLAYEHEVAIRLPGADIGKRLQEVRSACDTAKFGACVVLEVNRHTGESIGGRLRLRAVPAAIEPLIGGASAGGEVSRRRTHAEDLAVEVQENTLQQERLRREHARLSEFQQRKDLTVADMIALSKQLADTETQLANVKREAQQHQRRISTQLLTLDLVPPGSESGRSEIGQAFKEFGKVVSTSSAFLIRAFAALLPLAVFVFVVIIVIRRLRRRGQKS